MQHNDNNIVVMKAGNFDFPNPPVMGRAAYAFRLTSPGELFDSEKKSIPLSQRSVALPVNTP